MDRDSSGIPPIDVDLVDLSRPSAAAWRDLASRDSSAECEDPWSTLRLLDVDHPVDAVARAWRAGRAVGAQSRPWLHLPHDLATALDACETEPLAAARATVEAARWRSLVHGPGDWPLLAGRALERPGLEALDGRRLGALRALAELFHADDLRAAGELGAAAAAVAAARDRLPEQEPEIHGRFLVVASNLAVEQGDVTRAEHQLTAAHRLLEQVPVAGRGAEIPLRLARLALRRRRPGKARGLLLDAEQKVPRDRDLRLHLEILHDLLHLDVLLGHQREAEGRLDAIDELLVVAPADPGLAADRRRVRGRLALRQGHEDALRLLRAAARDLLALGRVREAVAALPDIQEASRDVTGLEELGRNSRLYHRLLEAPEVRRLPEPHASMIQAFARFVGAGHAQARVAAARRRASSGWTH